MCLVEDFNVSRGPDNEQLLVMRMPRTTAIGECIATLGGRWSEGDPLVFRGLLGGKLC